MFDKLEKVLGPLASKLSSNKVLTAIRDGFLVGTPLIIAASSQLRLWKKSNNVFIRYNETELLDSETGEIIPDSEYKELVYQTPYVDFKKTLQSKELEESILFSYQQDSKVILQQATRIGLKESQRLLNQNWCCLLLEKA